MDYLKSLTEVEYKDLCSSSNYIDYYVFSLHAMAILNENTETLLSLISQITSQDKFRKTLHSPIVYDQIESSLNTSLFNVLSSFYHFINYIETCFKKWFGKNSSETQFLMNKLSEYFDNNFVYRFFYKLRNYVTHCGIPINILFDGTDESGFIFTQTWYFSSDLLDKYSGWGSVVEKDLKNLETIMIFPLIFQFDEMKNKMWNEIHNFLVQTFVDPANRLNQLLGGIDNFNSNKKLSIISYDGVGTDLIYERLERGEKIQFKEKAIKTYILKLLLNSHGVK